ncbi:MAG: hypothetical protein QOI35_346, partial [Cryptosporangiaceae bacterium]|nr:hypothetical protein [Cryptosporangiaceae bacterium]
MSQPTLSGPSAVLPVPARTPLLASGAASVGSAMTRVAERLRLPFAGDARALVRRNEVRKHPIWQEPPLEAEGLPVLLVGGMLTAPPIMLS